MGFVNFISNMRKRDFGISKYLDTARRRQSLKKNYIMYLYKFGSRFSGQPVSICIKLGRMGWIGRLGWMPHRRGAWNDFCLQLSHNVNLGLCLGGVGCMKNSLRAAAAAVTPVFHPIFPPVSPGRTELILK